MGIVLIASPWLFDFADGGAAQWLPVILGASMIVLALMTDYELVAVRKISMRTHLMIDLLSGLLLAASPWIFSFADYVWEPHLILGLIEVGAALMTKREPSGEKGHHHRTAMH